MPLRLRDHRFQRDVAIALAIFAIAFVSVPAALCQAPSQAEFEKALATELPDDPAAVIAVVGQSKILLGDVKPKVDARINSVVEKSPQAVPEEQIKFARVNLTRGFLAQAIQTKMMRESFLLSQVGTQAADKRKEANELMGSKSAADVYRFRSAGIAETLQGQRHDRVGRKTARRR